MGIRIIVKIINLETVLANLDAIHEKAIQGVIKQTERLASDTNDAWRAATPRRSGRLSGGSGYKVSGMSFTLNNAVKYYPFVDEGHMSPKGWNTKHGYRPAKKRSHVPGHFMTNKAVEFIEEHILEYLSKFLDD